MSLLGDAYVRRGLELRSNHTHATNLGLGASHHVVGR